MLFLIFCVVRLHRLVVDHMIETTEITETAEMLETMEFLETAKMAEVARNEDKCRVNEVAMKKTLCINLFSACYKCFKIFETKFKSYKFTYICE